MKQQTAVEWLIEHLLDNGVGIHKKVRETALELEQIQKMELLNGNKGSDEIAFSKKDNMFNEEDMRKALDLGLNLIVDNVYNEEHFQKLINSIKQSKSTSSQTEISDEEILDAASRCRFNADVDISISSFEEGAKWYREQLKKTK